MKVKSLKLWGSGGQESQAGGLTQPGRGLPDKIQDAQANLNFSRVTPVCGSSEVQI